MSEKTEQKTETGLWKDALDKKTVSNIARQAKTVFDNFDEGGFVKSVCCRKYFKLELKDRISFIAEVLYSYLPSDYKRAVAIISKMAPRLGGFENWVLMAYIEKYGLDYFEESLSAMKNLTGYSTAEFAIRPFMIKYTDKIMPILSKWTSDPNEHIRRLAAEAARPRGVWVAHIEAFKKNPEPVLNLLEILKSDESLYVRKAVANNLNDISKDHPELVIKTCQRWKKDNNKHTDWIIKRACRSLIKAGNVDVLDIFGFRKNFKVKIDKFKLPVKIKIGETVKFSFNIKSSAKESQKLAIDYKIHYMKKYNQHSPKVFKLTERTISPSEQILITHKQSFANMTTRKHYPGIHFLEIIINGEPVHKKKFSLM